MTSAAGLRPFCAEAAEAVAARAADLNEEAGQNRAAAPGPDDMRRQFRGPGAAGLILMAEADAVPAGYCTRHTSYETEFAQRGLYMGDLSVARAHRRRGGARGATGRWDLPVVDLAARQCPPRRLLRGVGRSCGGGARPHAGRRRLRPPQRGGAAVIAIRRAGEADAAALAALLRALNTESGLHPERLTAEVVRRASIADPRSLALVAALGGAPARVATAHASFDPGGSRRGLCLSDLWVEAWARRQGVARALLAALSAEPACQVLWWNADAADALALACHRSLGAAEAAMVDFTLG